MSKLQNAVIGAGLAAAVFGADQLCKVHARKHADPLQIYRKEKKSAVRITYAENRGFALNLGEQHPMLVKGASLAVASACTAALFPAVQNGTALQVAGISFLLGGGLSNTYDRIARGEVTDYIGVGRVVYNLADFAIFAGMLMTVMEACGTD